MAGQLVRRGDRKWLVRVFVGRDNATGKRRYVNKTIHGTRKDAQKVLNQLLSEKDAHRLVTSSKRTLDEFILDWLDNTVRHRVRPKTLDDYRSLYLNQLKPGLGQHRLESISAMAIQKVYASMIDKGLSARTIRYAHSVLHGSLEQAVRWRLIAQNVSKMVELPRMKRREMSVLSRDEVVRFIEGARSDRFYALWLVLVTTGLRPGEALALQWSDIDGDRVRVQRALTWRKNGWSLAEPKTDRARRTVTIPEAVRMALGTHRRKQLEHQFSQGERYATLDLVFANDEGLPLDYHNLVKRNFGPILKRAELPKIRLYDLRHTSATLLLAAGEHPKVVSERLGHSSIVLTLDTYSHVLPDMQQHAAEKIDRLLFQSAG